MNTFQMSTGPIIRANICWLQEATNRLLKEFIKDISLEEEARNAYPNLKEVGMNYEGKATLFVLEVKGGNEGSLSDG